MLNFLFGEKWYVNYLENDGGILQRFEGRGNGFLRHIANVGDEVITAMPGARVVPNIITMNVLHVQRRITPRGVSFLITVEVIR